MYTEQNPFRLNDYVMLTYFLNNMLYKLINDNILGMFNLVYIKDALVNFWYLCRC